MTPDAELILALTGRTDLAVADLDARFRRVADNVRRESADAAELTERWRGRRISGAFTHERVVDVPWEGVVDRVLVGNPYNCPHARLTNGQIVPLPVEDGP